MENKKPIKVISLKDSIRTELIKRRKEKFFNQVYNTFLNAVFIQNAKKDNIKKIQPKESLLK